jgi:hypothetical protein
MSLHDIDLAMNSGQVIHQDEISVSVWVDDVGNDMVGGMDVRYFNSSLFIYTPVAERIAVYSLDRRMMYQAQKQPDIATFNLHSLPRGVLIVRGDSGRVKKIIK